MKPPLITQIPNYKPKPSASPSTIEEGLNCMRSVGFKKILGLRVRGKGKGALLGDLIHAALELHTTGAEGGIYGNIVSRVGRDTLEALDKLDPKTRADLIAKAPQRALAMIPHIAQPFPDGQRFVEQKNLQLVLDAKGEQVEIPLRMDLLDLSATGWARVTDYKSTSGAQPKGQPFNPWFYALTPEKLRENIQAICYAAYVFARYGSKIRIVQLQWIYGLTAEEKAPLAMSVDNCIWHYEIKGLVEKFVAPYAFEIARAIKSGAHPNTLWHGALPPEPDSYCSKWYPGCPFRADFGGPCDAIPTDDASLMFAAR